MLASLHLQHPVSGLTVCPERTPSLEGPPLTELYPHSRLHTRPPRGTHRGGALAVLSGLGCAAGQAQPVFPVAALAVALGTVQAELTVILPGGSRSAQRPPLGPPSTQTPSSPTAAAGRASHRGGLVWRNPTPGARGLCPPRPPDPPMGEAGSVASLK